jgi:hypothetical protein
METTSRRNVLRAIAVGAGVVGAASISPSALAFYNSNPALRDSAPVGDGTGSGTGKLTGRLVFPEDPGYADDRRIWNLQFNPYPLVIVFCQNADDVVNAITWSRQHDVAFRARGGRHALEGWSSVDGGVIIDVSDMQDIDLDADAQLATVQTGLPQDAIVNALGAHDFAIPTGAEIGVGVAGVTLGGGIGQLSRSLGVTSDSLVGVDIVVPQGERGACLIHADEEHYADLLWACKGGGGGNFGIATSYTFRIHPIDDVTVYQLTWDDWGLVNQLLDTWQHTAPSAEDGFGSVFNAKTETDGHIYCYGIYRGPEDELRQIIAPLLNIGDPQADIQTLRYVDAWNLLAGTSDDPVAAHIPSSWAYDLVPDKGIATIRKFLAELPGLEGEIWCLAWGGVQKRTRPDASAFPHRQPHFYIEWSGNWENDEQQSIVYSWTERFRKALQPYLKGSYVNVPDNSLADWPTAYYGDNYPRLRTVKTKYDPNEFFQYEQSIRPL